MTETLITKYRPTELSQIIGQDAVVRSLKKALEKKASRTFLFSGPPGVGKTTLARITAELLGCPTEEIIEIDGASQTGIDDMRAVVDGLRYRPLSESATKAVIVDEAHALSKAAVTSLLKVLEEPPAHVVWCLCTSDVGKLPAALKTRAAHYALKEVGFDELAELLHSVKTAETLTVPDKILDVCAEEAKGSPRQALSNLTVCLGASNVDDAREILRSSAESKEAIDLARALVQGARWREVQKLLGAMKEVNPEGARHVVRAYVTAVALNAKDEARAGHALEILDAFSTPFPSSDGVSPLLLACGKVLLS